MGFHPGRRAYPVSANTSNSISNKKGWIVGTNQTYGIGRPHNVNNVVSQKTTPYNYQDGKLKDDRNLVVQQNTLSGVGKMQSQFITSSAGIKSVRYYIGDKQSDEYFQEYQFTNTTLRYAVSLWINDNSLALDTYGDINTWDVSQVTDMSYLFKDKSNFNDDISSWNVSKVTNMKFMFNSATAFNQDIGSWTVTQVTDMNAMFLNAAAFNQDIGSWNVSKVRNMNAMFNSATAFNQDLSGWNVSENDDMRIIFDDATAILESYPNIASILGNIMTPISNEDWSNLWLIPFQFNNTTLPDAVTLWINNNTEALDTYGDINTWDVSQVTDMSSLFEGETTFNSDISNWDVSQVTDMQKMFWNARAFNQDISNWEVSQVTTMAGMFNQAIAFNQNIGSWDVSQVTNMLLMFNNATTFNQNLSGWTVTQVTNMDQMFQNAAAIREQYSSDPFLPVSPVPSQWSSYWSESP